MKEALLDIHGYVESDAIKEIEKTIAALDDDIKLLRIIHGHNEGHVLKNMIAHPHKVRSKRIKRRRYTKNPGETLLELY